MQSAHQRSGNTPQPRRYGNARDLSVSEAMRVIQFAFAVQGASNDAGTAFSRHMYAIRICHRKSALARLLRENDFTSQVPFFLFTEHGHQDDQIRHPRAKLSCQRRRVGKLCGTQFDPCPQARSKCKSATISSAAQQRRDDELSSSGSRGCLGYRGRDPRATATACRGK